MSDREQDDDHGNSPIQPISMLEAICKRPDNYTPHGSFDEVVSVISGICIALHIERKQMVRILQFDQWLKQQVALEMHPWSTMIRRESTDDVSALKKLVEYFRAFETESISPR
jgi:hypothetical protein